MTHDQIQHLADILEPALRHCLQTEFFPKSIPGALPGTLAHWGWWMEQLASNDDIRALPGQAPRLDMNQRFSDFLHMPLLHQEAFTYADSLKGMLLFRGLDKMMILTRESSPAAALQLEEFDVASLSENGMVTLNGHALLGALADKVEMICGEQTLRELFTFQPEPLPRWVSHHQVNSLRKVAEAIAASQPLPEWVQWCDVGNVRALAEACAA